MILVEAKIFKDMAKKVLFSIFSIFLIFQSIKVVGIISALDIESGWINFLLAIIVNLFVTGIFAFAGFIYPTEKLLPEGYYAIHNTSFQKKIYKLFKVETFRKFLLATVWRKKEAQKKFFDGTKSGIENLIVQSKKSDFGHLIPFVILCCLSIYWIAIGKWEVALLATLINVFFNFYPILLQRQHRMRIQLLGKRFNRKS